MWNAYSFFFQYQTTPPFLLFVRGRQMCFNYVCYIKQQVFAWWFKGSDLWNILNSWPTSWPTDDAHKQSLLKRYLHRQSLNLWFGHLSLLSGYRIKRGWDGASWYLELVWVRNWEDGAHLACCSSNQLKPTYLIPIKPVFSPSSCLKCNNKERKNIPDCNFFSSDNWILPEKCQSGSQQMQVWSRTDITWSAADLRFRTSM